jgi:hypothetical protein
MQIQNIQRFELKSEEVKDALIAFINQYETLPAGAEYEFSVRSGAVLSATITVNAPMQQREAPDAKPAYRQYAPNDRVKVDELGYGTVLQSLGNDTYYVSFDGEGGATRVHASVMHPSKTRVMESSRLENDEAGPFDDKAPQFPQGTRVRVYLPCKPEDDAQGYDLGTVAWNNIDDTEMGILVDGDKDMVKAKAPYHPLIGLASDGE